MFMRFTGSFSLSVSISTPRAEEKLLALVIAFAMSS